MQQNPSWDVNSPSGIQENRAFHKTRKFVALFTTARFFPMLTHINPVYALQNYYFMSA
jgi:hypothetical protein